jgi:hypothetical protein
MQNWLGGFLSRKTEDTLVKIRMSDSLVLHFFQNRNFTDHQIFFFSDVKEIKLVDCIN